MTTATVTAFMLSGAAFGQQPSPAPSQTTQSGNSGTVEDIVVTAQKRSENLQSVPISAQVVTGQALADNNQTNLIALSDTTPGLDIAQGAGTTKLYVRGTGSGTNSGFDQAVGTFVDDIYHGRSVEAVSSFLDVERVEVLKGPQSTYFGNNAIAGAVNIVTNKSDSEFNGYLRSGLGDYGQYTEEGAVGLPITDTLGVRVALFSSGQNGWVNNVTTGQTVPDINSLAGRVTLTWAPTDDFDAVLKVEGSQMRQRGDLADQIYGCPAQPQFTAFNGGNVGFCGAALKAGIPTNNLSNNENGDAAGEKVTLVSRGYDLTENYRKWDHTFTSVTGYYSYNYQQFVDPAASAVVMPSPANGPGGGLGGSLPEAYQQFSQEFRVASPTGQPIEYLTGVYFQHDRLNLNSIINFFELNPAIASHLRPLASFLPIGQDVELRQNENDYAGFGSVTWNISDQFKVTGGLRYSWVDKSYNWNEFYGTALGPYNGLAPLPNTASGIPGYTVGALPGLLGIGNVGTQNGSRSDHALLPSFRAQYQIDPEVLTYFSYAEGFLAGGFNGNNNNANGAVTASPTTIAFAPEHVDAYELGLKSRWFDKQVLLNVAAFRSDYQNLQVTVDSPTTAGTFISNVTNAAASVAQGLELDAQWAIDQHFRILLDGSFTDSHYENYAGVGLTQQQTLKYDQCLAARSKLACEAIGTQNLSGEPTVFAPKWSGDVTGRYQTDVLDDFNLTTELSAIFKSSYFLEATDDPLIKQPSYVRLDARVGLESPDGRWSFDIIGKNLTSRNIRTFGSPLSGSLGSLILSTEAPRTVTAQLSYYW